MKPEHRAPAVSAAGTQSQTSRQAPTFPTIRNSAVTMSENKPKLPGKKGAKSSSGKASAASTKNLPILQAQHITLEDGTKVPMKIPPNMPPEQAQAIVEFLKSNPEAAKQVYQQAQAMMQSPGLANAFLNMQKNVASNHQEQFAVLKDDPEFAHIFEEIQKEGPQAMRKYWDDTDLMSKISAKVRALNVGGAAQQQRSRQPEQISNLHDAAKCGDEAAAVKLIEDGADVNKKNARGVSPLGIAVGFNKLAIIKLLLERGADVMLRDGDGNTVLHYAAGYGRKDAAQLLLDAGAQLDAVNDAKQKPVDVARLNKEKLLVEFLTSKEQLQGESK